jgi:hypothetical protein
MNKDSAKDYLPLVQALAEGKSLQYNVNRSDEAPKWVDREDFTFDEPATEYRIKPEPREIWVNHYKDGRYSIHLTIKDADDAAPDLVEYKQVRYREVIE